MFCNILCYLDLSAVGCCFLWSFDAEVDVTGSEVTTVGDTSFIVQEGEVTILHNKDDQDSDSYSDTSSDSDDPTLYVAVSFVFLFSDVIISLWLCLWPSKLMQTLELISLLSPGWNLDSALWQILKQV